METDVLTAINDNLGKINITLLRIVKVLETTSKIHVDGIASLQLEQQKLKDYVEYEVKRMKIQTVHYE